MGAIMNAGLPVRDAPLAACRLCGASGWAPQENASRLVRMPPGTSVYTCRNCGLSIRHPLPSGVQTATTYDSGYYHTYQMVDREAPEQLLRWIPFLEERRGPGRLLEIGCGLGPFLKRAHQRGWAVQGIELSSWAANQACEAIRAGVVLARGEALPFRSGVFDAVVSHHVFEHLLDPIQALRESRRVCRPGGRLLIVLPNELQTLFSRWASRSPDELSKGRGLMATMQRWLAYQTPEPPQESSHVFFFRPRVLRMAARLTGWHPLRLTTYRSHRDTRSGYVLGGFVKTALYVLEKCLHRGREMALLAEAREAAP